MKRILLFVVSLTVGVNLSLCYADAPAEQLPSQTIRVHKRTVKNQADKDSICVNVALAKVSQGYCYYCAPENTWHIYTNDEKVVYQGGEISGGLATDWCWLRQSEDKKVFKSYRSRDFVNSQKPCEEQDRVLDISSSPELELVKDKNVTTEPYSKIRFHVHAYNALPIEDALKVTVSYIDSDGHRKTLLVQKDTTFARGSKIESVSIEKSKKDALAIQSISCGELNLYEGDIHDYMHEEIERTIPFSEMGVSEDSGVRLSIEYLTLDKETNAKVKQSWTATVKPEKEQADFRKTLESAAVKTTAVIFVIGLVAFCLVILIRSISNKPCKKDSAAPAPDSAPSRLTGAEEPDTDRLRHSLEAEKERNADLNRQLSEKEQSLKVKEAELARNKEKLAKLQDDCELLKKDKENLKAKLHESESDFRKREDALSAAIDNQRNEFEKELLEKDETHAKEIGHLCDRHKAEMDSVQEKNKAEIERLTADFETKDAMYLNDSLLRRNGGKVLLEEIFDAVSSLSSSAVSTSSYGKWVERMLDGDSANSLPVFFETFSGKDTAFEEYARMRAQIEAAVSDVNSWINTLARLASYAASAEIVADMQKDGADVNALLRTFEKTRVFMALYGYECIAPRLFHCRIDECSAEFVRDNTDLFVNRISGAVFKNVAPGIVCDLATVACVKLVDSSDGNRLIKGKVNSL